MGGDRQHDPLGTRPGHWPGGRAAMIASLTRPEAFPNRPSSVEYIETHISDVFLAGDLAYKIKKPANLGFCDFSTLQLRSHYVARELDLNRRLSPDVYLGISEVRWDERSGYSLDGVGEAVEPALRMRRLPADCALDQLVRHGGVDASVVRDIARKVAGLHGSASRAPVESAFGTPETVRDIVLNNIDRAVEHSGRFIGGAVFEDLRAFAEAFLDVRRPLFEVRSKGGHVRDCHGDLHAGNIFLLPGAGSGRADPHESERAIEIIDCIEFSDRLRVIDTVADIAFLAMDLEYLGRKDLAAILLDEYFTLSRESMARPLLNFYMAYRAAVRCMANGLRGDGMAARAYAELAQAIAARERPKLLVIMAGVTGSGKSTVARLIAGLWDIIHLQTDVIRKSLAGLDPHAQTSFALRERLYSPEMSVRTYREIERLGAEALASRRSVIMDGTFVKRDHRANAADIGRVNGATVVIVECSMSQELQLSRLHARYNSGLSVSEGDEAVYRVQIAEWEGVRSDEADVVVRLDTSPSQEEVERDALCKLWRAVLSTAGHAAQKGP